MKNIIRCIAIILATGSSLMLATRCSDFMEIYPSTQYTDDQVFSEPRLAEAYVTQLYNNIQHGAKEHTLDGLTDDAYFTHNYGQKAINETAITASSTEWFNDGNNPFRWQDRYSGIRNANVVIARIDDVPVKGNYTREVLNRMKGEAYYLRAHMYHELLRGYGGVPIVKDVYDMTEIEKMQIPRNNVGEVLDYILADLTLAESLLPATVSDAMTGRATKYAATGLKARIQLHIASALYADRTVNTLACNQYSGNRENLYRAARTAALEVITKGPFKLVDCTAGATAFDRGELFKAIITDRKNSEQMFVRQFGIDAGDKNFMGRWHGPNGYYNWAGTTPTHDLVMSFEMEDGSMYSGQLMDVGDFTSTPPYNGREPRFYATVATDGNPWGRPRSTAGAVFDPTPLGRLQAGTYELSSEGVAIERKLPTGVTINFSGIAGVDTRQGPIEDWNGSWTGYYERKLIDCAVNAMADPQAVPWTFMRLAEMYTIVAEASVELNELDDAADYIDILRARVGNVPCRTALSAQGKAFNQENLRDFIRHERRVEFAYESVRFFDVRRWMIAPETNSKPLKGIMVIGRLKAGQTQGRPYIHNEDKYTYTYYVNPVTNEARKWDNKLYFAPIRLEETRRNSQLQQNPGAY